ncbi:MAG: hypothetical protein WDN44_06195 [Sphingomonas sp.]
MRESCFVPAPQRSRDDEAWFFGVRLHKYHTAAADEPRITPPFSVAASALAHWDLQPERSSAPGGRPKMTNKLFGAALAASVAMAA